MPIHCEEKDGKCAGQQMKDRDKEIEKRMKKNEKEEKKGGGTSTNVVQITESEFSLDMGDSIGKGGRRVGGGGGGRESTLLDVSRWCRMRVVKEATAALCKGPSVNKQQESIIENTSEHNVLNGHNDSDVEPSREKGSIAHEVKPKKKSGPECCLVESMTLTNHVGNTSPIGRT
uniref:Uncharacterized protein n=1 Tax=Vespula pensylvanica TaxID=30213 RepID=A0A834PBA2_VESPE|nr:hypothetical protein H0235_002605 [Vespula pensylvanica]